MALVAERLALAAPAGQEGAEVAATVKEEEDSPVVEETARAARK